MSKAKAIPAPRGAVSPDSFRFYEALELGAVPITEDEKFWLIAAPMSGSISSSGGGVDCQRACIRLVSASVSLTCISFSRGDSSPV